MTILLRSSTSPSQSNLFISSCGDIPIITLLPLMAVVAALITDTCSFAPTTTPNPNLGPSGENLVKSISYSDPYLLISDPFMWNCQDRDKFQPMRSFSIVSSTHFTVFPQNDYLFLNCDADKVITEPKQLFCEWYPDRCDSSCDSSSYLCRHLPGCGLALGSRVSCCSYYPKAT